jgi:transglutaminase superfamily protein
MNNDCYKHLVEPCGHFTGQYRMHEMSIAPGNQGTVETLRIMARLARESLNYQDFCDFMADIVCNNVVLLSLPDDIDRYLRAIYRYENEDVETLYSPAYNAWQYRRTGMLRGDCDDISMFYAAVFTALGHKTRLVAMRTKRNDSEFHHVVVEIQYDPTLWKRFDATVPQGTAHNHYGTLIQYV